MHAVMIDSLEEYLAGTLEPAALRKVEAHLESCPMCGEELRSMQDVSRMFGTLRSQESLQPSPRFYARVMECAGQRQKAASLGSILGFDLLLARRLVFASVFTI